MSKNKNLTVKQKRFCQELIIDDNGKQAAIRAKYSERSAEVTASKLLSNAKVQEYVQKLRDKRSERLEITADRVLKELALIGFSDMKDYLDINEGGEVVLKTFKEMPDGASRVINKVKERKRIVSSGEGKGDEIVIDSQLEFGHHDKLKALELIGRNLGMFNDKLKLQGDKDEPLELGINLSDLSKEELKARIRDLVNN